MASPQMLTLLLIGVTVVLTLQGCGGGGSTTTTTTVAPTPAPTAAPTPAPPNSCGSSCTPPLDGHDMADYLNKNYNAFSNVTMKGDALGVYITMQVAGDLHHYCHAPCHNGFADCLLSVALYNKHIMLDGDVNGAHMKVFAGRSAGYIINTSMAETRYNKCAYIFDGASTYRLNQGCGDAAVGGASCADPPGTSAYYDMCPSTGAKCTIKDKEIQPNSNCEVIEQTHSRKWPNKTTDTPCYYTGPAFDYPNINEDNNKINQMVINRIYNQGWPAGSNMDARDRCGNDPPCQNSPTTHCNMECNRLAKWNEVAMDLRPMIDDLRADPNLVIPAFVYIKGHRHEAEALRTTFRKTYGAPGNQPLILMDVTVDVEHQDTMGKPFVFESAEGESNEVISDYI